MFENVLCDKVDGFFVVCDEDVFVIGGYFGYESCKFSGWECGFGCFFVLVVCRISIICVVFECLVGRWWFEGV